MGVCGIFRPPVQGGSNELISKFLSSMILYNHPSYFKSGEINSCRLSPLPSYSYVPFFVEFCPTFSANHALFFNILYPTGPQIVPVPFISISNQSSTFSVSLTHFFSIKPTPDTFVSHAVFCSV